MANFTNKKYLFCSLLLLASLSANAKDIKAPVAIVGKQNYTTFTTLTRAIDQSWLNYNKEYASHPDAGIFPRIKDDAGMIELYAERTRNTKFFINPLKPSEFVKEQSMGAIHYQKNGQWITIDTRLKALGTGVFEAGRQEEPVGFDINRKASFIKSNKGTVYFNNWQLYGEKNGASTLLATANWSDYTAGDDGLYVRNIFPGMDATMEVKKGSIKTNFIISRNEFAGYTTFKFRDAFQGDGTSSFSYVTTNSNSAYAGDINYNVNGKTILRIDKGIAFTQGEHVTDAANRDLTYEFTGSKLTLNVDAAYVNRQLAFGKVVVDPMVQTISVYNRALITGSMNCGSATNSCNYTIPVTPPAGAVITAVDFKFQMFVNSPARLNQALFRIAAGTCYQSGTVGANNTALGPGYVYTPDSVSTPNIAGYWNVFSDSLKKCMPPPSCPATTIPFTLLFWNTYCAAGPTGCSNLYVFADSNFSVRVRGTTFEATPISRSSNTVICQGTSVTLSRSGTFGVPPYSYSWLPGGQTTASITVAPNATTRYTSIIRDSCGNTYTDTTTVRVESPNDIPQFTSPLRVCQFDTPIPLPATGPNLKWYATATGGNPLPLTPTLPTSTPGTYTYYVSLTNICGEGPRVPYTVIVNSKPAPPSVISPLGLCQYDQVNLTASGSGTFTWYYNPTGGAGVPQLSPATAYEDSAYYYVTQTVNGCESDRARLQVFVSYKPNGIVTPSRLWVCAGELDTFMYFGNSRPPQAVFNWTTSRPNNEIVSGQGTTGPLVVRFDSAGLHTVSVQVNNRGCLSTIATQPISVRPNPRLTFITKEEACQDEIIDVALTGMTPGVDSFTYSFPGAEIVYGSQTGGPFGIRYNTWGAKIITSVATTRECPSRPYADTIIIHPLPDTRFRMVSNSSICAGDTLVLEVLRPDSGTRYFWTPDRFFTNGNIFRATGTIMESGFIKVSGVSPYGCKAADSLYLQTGMCCEMYFPNAFTPNNDTKNDVFRPVTKGHHIIKTFRVINRWGQVVFESKNDRGAWDGTFNGKPQDGGTYYYYIRYSCLEGGAQDLEQKGELLLVR